MSPLIIFAGTANTVNYISCFAFLTAMSLAVQIEKLTQLSSLKKQYEDYSERLANLYAKQERRTIERYYKASDSVKKRKTVAGMVCYLIDHLTNRLVHL
jgi:predicted naringenin-chalcone synthase